MVGIILGGVAGIGTLICLVILGPLTQRFFPSIDTIVKPFVQEIRELHNLTRIELK